MEINFLHCISSYLDLFGFRNLCTCGCKQIYFLGGYKRGQSVLSSRCQMDQIHPCIWGILTINNTFIIYNLPVLESDFISWFHAFQQPDTWIFFNLHKFYVAKIEFHQKITQTTKKWGLTSMILQIWVLSNRIWQRREFRLHFWSIPKKTKHASVAQYRKTRICPYRKSPATINLRKYKPL